VSRKRWIIVGVLLILLVAVLLVTPYRSGQVYRCPYCRAVLVRSSVFVIPLPPKLHETKFARFWRSQVEPNHTHMWWFDYSGKQWILGGGYHGDAEPNPLPRLLSEETEIVVLRGLPTRAARKRFVDLLCRTNQTDRAQWQKVRDAIHEIMLMYEENPKRKDWPKVLKKLGMYP